MARFDPGGGREGGTAATTIANAKRGRAAMGVAPSVRWIFAGSCPNPIGGGAARRLGRFGRSGFHVEAARSRMRLDRRRARLGMPVGPGTAHVVKPGTIGVE